MLDVFWSCITLFQSFTNVETGEVFMSIMVELPRKRLSVDGRGQELVPPELLWMKEAECGATPCGAIKKIFPAKLMLLALKPLHCVNL